MPTTSAIAGTVSGRRQMNSMIRVKPGRRSRTQTMVGSSKTSIPIEVIAASSRETEIACTRSGTLMMSAQVSSVRGAVRLLPRVENSTMAPIGTRKNAPMTRKTVARKTPSLKRRARFTRARPAGGYSSQPSATSLLQHGVQDRDDRDDENHRHSERFREPRLGAACLAGQQVADCQGHDEAPLGDEGLRRGVS